MNNKRNKIFKNIPTLEQIKKKKQIKLHQQRVTQITQEKNKINDQNKIKIVLIGDGGSGKTSLLISFTSDKFDQNYKPTIFEVSDMIIRKNSKVYSLELWDTPGQQQFKCLRSLSYPKTDVFLICFSLVDRKSFKNATTKWLPQIIQNCQSPQIIFIGTKSDLQSQVDPNSMINTQFQVLNQQIITKKIKELNYQFIPCSSVTQVGLSKIFDQSIDKVMNKRNKPIIKNEQNNECQLI